MSLSKPKSTSLTVICLSGLSLLAFTAKQGEGDSPITTSKSYQSTDFGRMEVLGACSMTPDAINCWDADGKPNADLSKQIEAYYIVETKTALEFKYGRKNRLLVVRTAPVRNANVTKGAFGTCKGRLLSRAGEIGRYTAGRGTSMEWYAYDADPNEKTASLNFSLTIFWGESPLRVQSGAEAQVGALKFHVDGIAPGPDRVAWDGSHNLHQKIWNVAVSISGVPTDAKIPDLSFRALDKNGTTIMLVAPNGTPLPNTIKDGATSKAGTSPAMPYCIQGERTSHQIIAMADDPSKVAGISISGYSTRSVTLTGIPLDPK